MNSLLPFRGDGGVGDPIFDVSDLLHEVAESADEFANSRRVSVEVDSPPCTLVAADRGRLEQAFQQLLAAAISCTAHGGEVVMTAYTDEDGVEVEIAEGGADMIDSPEAADRDPSLQQQLDEVRRLLVADGIELESSPCADGGIAYTLFFPATGETPDQKSQKAA